VTTPTSTASRLTGVRGTQKGIPSRSNEGLETCAAVVIDDGHSANPTFTNCFFVRNSVAAAVIASANCAENGCVVSHDGTSFINCTFALNVIGLWNGQFTTDLDGPPVVGWSKLIVHNCVFDSTFYEGAGDPRSQELLPLLVPPSDPPITQQEDINGTGVFRANTSPFEGLTLDDRYVTSVATPTQYIAFELGRENVFTSNTLDLFDPPIEVLPATLPRTTPGFSLLPLVNIAPNTMNLMYNDSPTTALGRRRGVLFVRDLLATINSNGPWGDAPPTHDLSPHDFRLSPQAALASDDVVTPSAQNPLVDCGSTALPLTFANGLVLTEPPFSLDVDPIYPFHAWNYDCEGYGNPRIADHPVFMGDEIDLGADELDELLIAGYLDRTRSFVRLATIGPGNAPRENAILWYLGPSAALDASYASLTGTGGFPPSYADLPGYTVNDGAGTGDPNAQLEFLPLWFTGEDRYNPGADRFDIPIARARRLHRWPTPSTAADITPHLLPDIHPYWTAQSLGVPARTEPLCMGRLQWRERRSLQSRRSTFHRRLWSHQSSRSTIPGTEAQWIDFVNNRWFFGWDRPAGASSSYLSRTPGDASSLTTIGPVAEPVEPRQPTRRPRSTER
jgi:hypothetical protein